MTPRRGDTTPTAEEKPPARPIAPALILAVFVNLAVAAVPILLVCNFSRLMTWGLVSIYGGAHPLSPVPRGAAAVVSILLAYVLFAVFLAGLSRVVVSDETIPAASPS